MIKKLKKHFGNISVVRGNKHIFSGVNIEIKDKIIKIDMVKQLEDCIAMFGGNASTSMSSLATNKFLN